MSSAANDPRNRRNSQAALATDVIYGDGFEVGKGQRLNIATGTGLTTRNGRLQLNSQPAPPVVQATTGTVSMSDINRLITTINSMREALRAAGVFI